MFVIVQAWSNIPPEIHHSNDIPERIGMALKHAVSDLVNIMQILHVVKTHYRNECYNNVFTTIPVAAESEISNKGL